MILTVHYPESGTTRTHRNLSQAQCNKLVTHISDCQDTVGEVAVRVLVTDDVVRDKGVSPDHICVECKHVRHNPTQASACCTMQGDDCPECQIQVLASLDFHAGEVH